MDTAAERHQLADALRQVDQAAVRKAGFITKSDPKGWSWKKRGFILRGFQLEYYKCDGASYSVQGEWGASAELKGVVDCTACSFLESKNKGAGTWQINLGVLASANPRTVPNVSRKC
jgi:hypothetical protein